MTDFGKYINIEYFFYKIYELFAFIGRLIFGSDQSSVGSSGGIFANFSDFLFFLKNFLQFLIVILLIGIIYSIVRLYEIEKKERRRLDSLALAIDDKPYENKQWEVVLEHTYSDIPSDWRLAVIEADNMLDEMVKKLGYEGEDLGERLKAVEPADFESLESAWEAHKVRNKIVHEGVGFELTKDDTERIIKLYERVFREFSYI